MTAQIAGMGGFDLPARLIVHAFSSHERLNLGLGENDATLGGHFGFQGLQAVLEVGQIMAQPDRPHAGLKFHHWPE